MKEFRIILRDRPGELARICGALASQGVNISTIAAVVDSDPATIAFITAYEQRTSSILQSLNIDFQKVDIISIKIPDQPGELEKITEKLANADINIESIYLLAKSRGETQLVFSASDMIGAKKALGI